MSNQATYERTAISHNGRRGARGGGRSQRTPAPIKPTWGFLLINAAFVVAGAAIAGWALSPVYDSLRYSATVAAATLGGAAIAVLCVVLRRGAGTAILALLGAYVVGGIVLAVPGAMGGFGGLLDALVELARGPVLGWMDIVTLPLPLGEYGATLVPVLALFLTASLLATWAALRARRLWALGVLVLGLLMVVAIALGPAVRASALGWAPQAFGMSREFLVGLALLMLVLAWFGWRAAYVRRRALVHAQGAATARLVRAPRVRTLGGAAAVAVMVTVAIAMGVVIAGPLAASTPREVARSSIDPELTIAASVSPLASYRTYFEDAAYDAVLFTVDVTEGAPARVRLASLSHFDGETFSASAGPGEPPVRFSRVPSRIPGGEDTEKVAAEITMGAGGGIWVPLLGKLGSVTFHGPRQAQLVDGFYYLEEDAAGVMGAEGGIVTGDRVSVRANVPAPTPVLADLGAPPGVPSVDRELIPESVTEWVERQGVSRDGEGLAELIDRLRARGYLSHGLDEAPEGTIPQWQAALASYRFAPSPAGHSYDRIDRLFLELLEQEATMAANPNGSLVSAVGDDEQFAAAAALLAAELGYPSRVVVGARLQDTDPQGWAPAPCDMGQCKGQNLTAWVEVQGTDGQWVAADVTPQHEAPLAPEISTQRDPEFATALDPQRAELIVPPASQRGATSDNDPTLDDQGTAPEWLATALWIAGLSLLVLIVVLGPFMAIVLWKVLRRRRRRRGQPSDVIYGGWDEYVDVAVEAGLEPAPLSTRRETALEYASPHGTRIAWLADRATFSGAAAVPAEAAELWQLVAADRKAWLAQKGWWSRLRMRLSLRAVWHSVVRATSATTLSTPAEGPRWRSDHTGGTGTRGASSSSQRTRRRLRRARQ